MQERYMGQTEYARRNKTRDLDDGLGWPKVLATLEGHHGCTVLDVEPGMCATSTLRPFSQGSDFEQSFSQQGLGR